MSRVLSMPRRVVSNWSMSPGVSTTIARMRDKPVSPFIFRGGPTITGSEISTKWSGQQWQGGTLGAGWSGGGLPSSTPFGLVYADNIDDMVDGNGAIELPFADGSFTKTYTSGLLNGVIVSRAGQVTYAYTPPSPGAVLYVNLFKMWSETNNNRVFTSPFGSVQIGGPAIPLDGRLSTYVSHTPEQYFAEFVYLSNTMSFIYKATL